MAKTVAMICWGRWGRRIALGIYKDRQYKLRSAIGDLPNEVYRHSENPATPLAEDKEKISYQRIADTLVEHGIVPTKEEAEGDTEESPHEQDKTIDILIIDLGEVDSEKRWGMNDKLVTLLQEHTREKIFVKVGDLEEKKSYGSKNIVKAVCPDIESADRIVSSLTGKQNPSA